MIPKNILYFWHDFSEIPNIIAQAISKTAQVNCEYQIIKSDDRHALDLIKVYGKKACALYKNISIPAARSDIARLLLLQEYGGIYLDAAIEVSTPLSALHQDSDKFITLSIDRLQKNLLLTHVCNGFLGSVPNFDLISELIETILDTLYSKKYNNEVWFSTGPFFLNLLLKKYNIENVRQLRVTDLQGTSLRWCGFPGVSNSWTITQKNGIVLDQFYLEYPKSSGSIVDDLYTQLLSNESFTSNPKSLNDLGMRFIIEGKLNLAHSILLKAKSALELWPDDDTSKISEEINERIITSKDF